MATYSYTAIDLKSGEMQRGSIEGSSPAQAAQLLKRQGLAPTELAVETPRPARRLFRRWATGSVMRGLGIGRSISRRQLTPFTRQLATLVNAGMPLARGLEVLGRQERSPAFRDVLVELSEVIGAGGSLSDGLLRHPRVFDSLYINMVKGGEAGGALGAVLVRLAQFLEKRERLIGRLKTAMIYPVIIMAVAAGIVSVLMVFVVPKFEQIFSGLLKGQPLPALTRGLLGVSTFARGQALLVLGIGVLVWLGFRAFRKTASGTRSMDWMAIKVPVIGDLALKASIARFTRTLGSLLSSGVPILDALVITQATSGNIHVSNALGHVHDRIKQGDTIAQPLEATGIFPGMVTGMIQVGEETGDLPEMLGRIADTYDQEVDNAVTGLTSIIEPIMIVVMAVVVGGIVIALFLPIVSVIQHLQ